MQSDLDTLINLLGKLPGLGRRSARRCVLYLVKNRESLLLPLANALDKTILNVKICESCGNVDDVTPCRICKDSRRSIDKICVVEDVADLWAIERSNIFSGIYHVLGGTLSALDGRRPEDLSIEKLVIKASNGDVSEVILATSATIEGQTTAHYIAERLKDLSVQVSQIAHGIPIGGELDYLDDGTLGAALKARKVV
jgi:recombination protein RecR